MANYNSIHRKSEEILTPEEITTYARWLNLVNQTGVVYAIGGAFALHAYTGIWRNTKDLDLFMPPHGIKTVLDAMGLAGYETEITNPAWLAKIRQRPYSMDLIFRISDGGHIISDELLRRRQAHKLQESSTYVMGLEELILSKAYIAKHYRFDGPDIAHLIRSRLDELDWDYLAELFGEHDELLLWYLIYFQFVYPGESRRLPRSLMRRLFEKHAGDRETGNGEPEFRGQVLDRSSFEIDCRIWGYASAAMRKPLLNDSGETL